MQIYFGAANIDDLIDPTGMLACPEINDTLFYYGVEYGSNPGGTEEVRIYDGCDRSIPVDIESVESLITALEGVLANHYALQVAKNIEDNVINPTYSKAII